MRRWAGYIGLVLFLALSAVARGEARQFNTRHYRVHTDLDADLAADLSERLDAMYDLYAQRLALFGRDALPRLEVYLFRSQREYAAFTGGKMQNSSGVFLPGKNCLAAFLGDLGRDQLRRTLQHEAFHQFAYNAITRNFPVWLNEGLAQFFEEGLWNGQGFQLGEVPPRRLRQVNADIKASRLIPFSVLLHMDNDTWTHRLATSRSVGVTQYNQSWAMVHFLVMAQGKDGEYLFRSRVIEMLRLMHAGKSGEDAFREAFGTNVDGFHQRFLAYASTLRPTAEATMIENQGVLADLMIDFDRNGQRFSDIASLRRFVIKGHYILHYYCGALTWETDPDMNTYFCDLNGRPFDSDELYLSPRTGAPLPDIACRYGGRLVLRTRFHEAENGAVDHELLIEPINSSASISN